MAKKKNQITTKQIIILAIIFITIVAYTLYQGAVIKSLKTKTDLEQQIKILRAKHIEISKNLEDLELEGNIEKEIKKRGLDLIKDDYPKIIYVEPGKTKTK